MHKKGNHPQHIGCTVRSCRYNGEQDTCQLMSIMVAPKAGCDSGKPEESLCNSYESGVR